MVASLVLLLCDSDRLRASRRLEGSDYGQEGQQQAPEGALRPVARGVQRPLLEGAAPPPAASRDLRRRGCPS